MKKLLAEAGYPNGQGFPKVEILFNTSESHKSIAEAIQQMWKRELGVNIGLYNQEGKVWTDSMRTMSYQIGRFAWVGDYLDPSTFLDIMASDSGNNHTGWGNAEYDRLLDEAARTLLRQLAMQLHCIGGGETGRGKRSAAAAMIKTNTQCTDDSGRQFAAR